DVSAALAAANITGFTVAAGGGTSVVITDPSGNAFQPSDAITDAAGATFTTTPVNGTTNANQWTASATIAGGVIAPLGANNKVVFNTDGTLSAATTLSSIQVSSWTSGGATAPQTLNLNLGTPTQANGLTQFGSAFAVSEVNQDGLHFGNFTGVTIDQVGIVTANFDNGLKQAIYLIPIATFPNPNALDAQSGNVYLQTNDSGTFLLRQAGQGAAGQIAPSSLENSTVDIAQEFSNLIITQRAYEPNTKIITTADQMLQSLINAKQ
ncbi:MAG TPA: flagellar hook-basal body complex protein, partial [Stellaceae bacterium]|nr:flagellar hook-basal body complex protein [Stellaceae bacterium]